jgi:hypothetical protein
MLFSTERAARQRTTILALLGVAIILLVILLIRS